MHAKGLLVVLTLGMCLLFAAGCAQQTKPTSSEDNTKPGQTEQAASTKNDAPADTSLDPARPSLPRRGLRKHWHSVKAEPGAGCSL